MMRKQISTILLIVLLAQVTLIKFIKKCTFYIFITLQSSSATPIPQPGLFDGLITIINGIVTNITDFANTFTSAFTNIFGPNGTISLQNLNNTWTNITQGITGLFNTTTITQITGSLINQTLANLNTTLSDIISVFTNITRLLNFTTPANSPSLISAIQNISKLVNVSLANLTSTLKASGVTTNLLPNLSILQSLTNNLVQQIQSSSLLSNNLTSMITGLNSLASSIISNMAAVSTQFATNATLTQLLAQLRNSSTAVNATMLATINKLRQTLVNNTRAVATSGVNTLASNIGNLLINLNARTANSISSIGAANKQLTTASGTFFSLIISPYLATTLPFVQSTVNNFNSLLASGYLNAQSQVIAFINSMNSTITNATQIIGSITGNLTSQIAANLTSNVTKVRQCAQTSFPVAQTLMQNSISSVANCTGNVTTTIQSLLSTVNSTISGAGQGIITQFNAAIACLSSPIFTRFGCLQTAINRILNSTTTLQPVVTSLATQIQYTLGNLTQSLQACIGTTTGSANSSVNALAANFTTCVKT